MPCPTMVLGASAGPFEHILCAIGQVGESIAIRLRRESKGCEKHTHTQLPESLGKAASSLLKNMSLLERVASNVGTPPN